jgi:transposase
LAQHAEREVAQGYLRAIDTAAITGEMSTLGRFLVTRQQSDIASFKTPGLRNVVVTGPYFHDGSMQTLWDVMDHYNKGDGITDHRLMQHHKRDLLMRQRTQVINALRAHLAELGIVAAQEREGLKHLLTIIVDEKDARLPVDARASLIVLAAQLQALQTMIGSIEKRLTVQHRANEASKRLESVPGIGIIGASAIATTVTDPNVFRSGRDFAAWIGLVPRQDSTGGKQKLGPISKQGDRYLRRILVVGAQSVLRRARQNPEKYPWLTQLMARRPFKVVAVALANKMARVAWALLARGAPIECLRSRQRKKRLSDGRMRLRRCIS